MDESIKLPETWKHPDAQWYKFNCGHWVMIRVGERLDGCPRCKQLHMRDERDPYPNRREPR